MTIKSVFDPEFAEYGKVVEGYDFTELLGILRQISPKPEDAVIYVPSVKELEALPVCKDLSDRAYGGMPIQIGYCNGSNTKLNSLEYHRDSEINIADDDMILLLGREQDIQNGQYDTAKVVLWRCMARLCTTRPVRETGEPDFGLWSFFQRVPIRRSRPSRRHVKKTGG